MIDRFLPENPILRRVSVYAAAVAAVLVATQLVFPGSPGGARGTPAAILFTGLVSGLVISLFSVGVVLMYRTMRFINFAQGPIGLVGVTLSSYFLVFTDVPFPLVLLMSLVVCAGLGGLAGLFLLRFFKGSRLFLTVVTIVGSGFIVSSVVSGVSRLPFWPPPDRLSSTDLQDLSQISDDLPFRGFHFRVGSFPLDFGFHHLFAIELAIVTLVGLVLFLRFTRAGTAIRAMAENPERASLLGIGVGGLSVLVWVIAGALDGVGTFLASAAAPGTFISDGGFSFAVLLVPLAPAVLARFKDIGTAVFAAVMIGILRESWQFSYDDIGVFSVFLFALVAGGLLAQRRQFGRSEAGQAVSWSATEEPRPIPHELKGITGLRIARYAILGTLGVLILVLPFILSEGRVFLASVILINAIAVLSLVVLTGWAGQVSLGQYGLMAVGSVIGGSLTANIGLPFWIAVPVTTGLVAGLAVIVGLPALRIKGLFLLVTTFAFAVAVSDVLFNDKYFGWLLPDVVDRPTLFFINFEDNRSMYYLSLAALGLAVLVVTNLRKSRVGRLLIALRENEANVQSFGVSAVRLKLLAFAIAGGMAGFAGAIFAHQQHGVSAESFSPDQSVFVFIAAVVGGVSSSGGALLGSAYIKLTEEFTRSNQIAAALFQGFAPLLILFMVPGGLIAVVNGIRDSVLRIVAQRRQIVVPSLFADYDPDLLARRLIHLGEPSPVGGIAALPPEVRFTMASELYKGRGERIVDRLAGRKASKEAQAFGAAARRADDDDAALAVPVETRS